MVLFAFVFFAGNIQAQTAKEGDADNQQKATVDDVLATGEPGTIALTQEKQGSETYTATFRLRGSYQLMPADLWLSKAICHG